MKERKQVAVPNPDAAVQELYFSAPTRRRRGSGSLDIPAPVPLDGVEEIWSTVIFPQSTEDKSGSLVYALPMVAAAELVRKVDLTLGTSSYHHDAKCTLRWRNDCVEVGRLILRNDLRGDWYSVTFLVNGEAVNTKTVAPPRGDPRNISVVYATQKLWTDRSKPWNIRITAFRSPARRSGE